MSVKKLVEMYEQSENKDNKEVLDYLKQYIEIKEKLNNINKYIDDEINNLSDSASKFNLNQRDPLVLRLNVFKDIKSKL